MPRASANTVRRRLRSAEPQLALLPDIKPLNPELVYTEGEVARFLRLKNKRTLSVWRCTGAQPALRYRKVGSRVVYLGADVLAFLSAKPAKPKKAGTRKAKP